MFTSPGVIADEILRDICRTFPNQAFFQSSKGQKKLFYIMHAYSKYDPEVGYCQGMSFIAGLLLLSLEPADAFALFTFVMKEVDMRELYKPGMAGLLVSTI